MNQYFPTIMVYVNNYSLYECTITGMFQVHQSVLNQYIICYCLHNNGKKLYGHDKYSLLIYTKYGIF